MLYSILRERMNPEDIVLEQTTKELFEEFKGFWHREAWENRDAILLRITKPIISNSWGELFYSFLEHVYADEISVVSNEKWTRGYARELRGNKDRLKEITGVAANNRSCRVELKYEIKPLRWKGRQPRVEINFQFYQGKIISLQADTNPDREGKISQLLTIYPASVKGATRPYHALWVPDDYKTRLYLP